MTWLYPDLGSASVLVKTSFPNGTTNQKHYLDLGSEGQCGVSARVPPTKFSEETSVWHRTRLFSRATLGDL